jgi:hypothetical protein
MGDPWDEAAERRLRKAMRDSAGKGRRGTDRAINRGNRGGSGGCLPVLLLAGAVAVAMILAVCLPVIATGGTTTALSTCCNCGKGRTS